jgi:predicted dehydrogenase
MSNRVGIVGCGHIANQHLGQLKPMRGVELVGVCDRNLQSATVMARRFEIEKVFHDLGAFLRGCAPQVVHVLTPPQTHKDIALEAMASGCHVLVEKPLAVDARAAQMLVEAAQRAGVRLGVCHNYLFVPALVAARKLIASGKPGRILSAELFWKVTSFQGSRRQQIPSWVRDLPGGIFHEIAPHPVYLLRAAMGNLEVVSACAKKMDPAGPYPADELKVVFNSACGPAVMAISVGTQPVQKFIRIYGTDLTLHIDLTTSTLLKLRPYGRGDAGRALGNIDQALQIVAQTGNNALRYAVGKLPRGHTGVIAHFYKHLSDERPTDIDGRQGLMTVALLDRIWATMELLE